MLASTSSKARTRAEINAAMERREAPASSKRGRGRRRNGSASRRSIPSAFCEGQGLVRRSPQGEGGRDDGVPGAANNTGAGAWLFDNFGWSRG